MASEVSGIITFWLEGARIWERAAASDDPCHYSIEQCLQFAAECRALSAKSESAQP